MAAMSWGLGLSPADCGPEAAWSDNQGIIAAEHILH